MGTPAIRDGLVYIGDAARTVHCIDQKDGKAVWTHKVGGEMWASPLVADGKVYVGTRKGDFWILGAGREKKVLSEADLGAPISGTAAAANGVVYVATMKGAWALR
jgi:outer membrane protein assembly factor BamB